MRRTVYRTVFIHIKSIIFLIYVSNIVMESMHQKTNINVYSITIIYPTTKNF